MNYYDVNVSLGGWPFRHVPRHTAQECHEDLTALGCKGALVTNNGSILYADTREANRELADMIRPYAGFFYGCATINPTWPHAEQELDECLDVHGFKAVRLLPRFHGYKLDEAVPFIRYAAKRGVPVVVPFEIVDFRQQGFLEPKTPFYYEELVPVAQAVPEATFVWLFCSLPADAPANVYGEFDRFAPGADRRLLFGSNMPLRLPASMIKFETEPMDDETRAIIACGNFQKLFLGK